MHTTAEYLDSLQQDLAGTIVALGLDPTTKFTDIKDMAVEGEITVGGGGDISEYFLSTLEGTNMAYNLIKKIPRFTFTASSSYNCSNMFKNMISLESVDLSGLNTANSTSFASMFQSCTSLKELDLTNINFSGNTTGNFSYMFSGCGSLESITFSPSADFSRAYYVNEMFRDCLSLTNLDLSFIGTCGITTLQYMFRGCKKLEKIDLSNFNITSALSSSSQTNQMFYQCSKMERLDMRSFEFSTKCTGQALQYIFQGLPANCLIIVKDSTEKAYLQNAYSNLTNIKTPGEVQE